jgi:hypothetical protein
VNSVEGCEAEKWIAARKSVTGTLQILWKVYGKQMISQS